MNFLLLLVLLTAKTYAFNANDTEIGERITKGQEATPKQFPYQAGLLLTVNGKSYWCGGTLLSDRWILTAAHCTKGATKVKVILGGLKSNPNGDTGEAVVDVPGNSETIFVHKKYNSHYIVNDVSLIKLPKPVTLSEYIKPASLPKFTGNTPTYSGKTGVISGWGRVSDSNKQTSPTLQWTNVPIISNSECASYYGTLASSTICISTKGTHKSTCNGDSGGPLVLQGTNTLVGITSFSSAYGCEKGYPAGFSRVTSFLEWIKDISGITP